MDGAGMKNLLLSSCGPALARGSTPLSWAALNGNGVFRAQHKPPKKRPTRLFHEFVEYAV
jgi:hypothetical protein